MPKLPPIHPGEVLPSEFLEPHGLSQYRLAKDIRVPPRRVNEIVLGKRGITADTALRLSRYFGPSDRFWLNLQTCACAASWTTKSSNLPLARKYSTET